MSEYVFPKSFSYTDGTGSGSNGCEPPCVGCDSCVDGACVPGTTYPCKTCDYGDGSIFPPGTSMDSHYIDTSDTSCSPDGCCPAKPRDVNNPNEITTVFNCRSKEIVTTIALPRIKKTGPGTLVIIPPSSDIDPNNRPFCEVLDIEEGTVILNDAEAFKLDSTKLIFGKVFVCGLDLNIGTSRAQVNSIDFGPKSPSVSYTSNSSELYGKINVGFGGMTIAPNGISTDDLETLLISGRNGGTWDGEVGFTTDRDINGIRSIGYSSASGPTNVAWAAPGDTNLDSNIDILDIANILSSQKYNSDEKANWIEGDFNYDGKLDALDVAALLGGGFYGSDNYFPKDTSFTIKWTFQMCPDMIYEDGGVRGDSSTIYNNPRTITVSTANNARGVSTIRSMTPPFISSANSKESVLGCEILTKVQCNSKKESVFIAGGNCNDASCQSHAMPSPKSGACCVPNDNVLVIGAPITYNCEMVSDTSMSTAESYCAKVLRGTFKGYNSVCVDQSCGSKSITVPTTPVYNPNKPTWGGCCITQRVGGTSVPRGYCSILNDQPGYTTVNGGQTSVTPGKTAIQQCAEVGGVFSGYGFECFNCGDLGGV